MSARFVQNLMAVVAVVGAAVTLTGIVLTVRAVSARQETARVQRGPRVLAVIEATGRVSGRHQRVTLRYSDRAGGNHELDVSYPLGIAEETDVGASTSVVYDNRAPARAELAGHPRHSWQDAALAAALTVAATGGWLRWLLVLNLAARREEEQPSIRLGPPGTVERQPGPSVPRSRGHAYGTLAVVCLLLLTGGKLAAQLVAFDRPQEVGFPPLPVLSAHRGPVVLPAVLTAPPSRSGPLVTPSTAEAVAGAAWHFRDDALAQHDLAEVRAIDADPTLAADVEKLKDGDAPHRPVPTPGDLHDLTAYTPRQTGWPIRLLAQAVTTSGGAPVLEVMVLTRRGPGASWRVALDNVVSGNAHFTPAVQPPILDSSGYDVVPPLTWIAPSAVVPELARYWQSFREIGHAPSSGVAFSPGYWTTDYGQRMHRQDSTDVNGLKAHVLYSDRPAPEDELWTFGVYGSWTLVCSPLYQTKTWAGPAHQDRNRQKWGRDLAPGVYRAITAKFVREPCLIVPPLPAAAGIDGIVVFGADPWAIATSGER